MAKQKYYVVWVGKAPGIYHAWSECQAQVNGYVGAKYKAYSSEEEAKQAYRDGWQQNWGQGAEKSVSTQASTLSKSNKVGNKALATEQDSDEIDYYSISVDVGTAGNPGPIEYKGVDTGTGEVIFSVGPIPNGTNNLGEYLAIVHALAYLHKNNDQRNIYSDSVTAMKWVRDKKPNTNLVRNSSTAQVWDLVDRATAWLQAHTYTTKVMKWKTEQWGEIKADYGRK